jgi:hypothetical protein
MSKVKNLATIGGNTFTKNSVANDLYHFAVVYGVPASVARRKAEAILASAEKKKSWTASMFGMDEVDFQALHAENLANAEQECVKALQTLADLADVADLTPVWVEASFHIGLLQAEKAKKGSKFAYAEVVEVVHPHLEV